MFSSCAWYDSIFLFSLISCQVPVPHLQKKPARRRYENYGMYSDDDANSDASSACSERSYSSRNGGAIPTYMRQTEDVAEVSSKDTNKRYKDKNREDFNWCYHTDLYSLEFYLNPFIFVFLPQSLCNRLILIVGWAWWTLSMTETDEEALIFNSILYHKPLYFYFPLCKSLNRPLCVCMCVFVVLAGAEPLC